MGRHSVSRVTPPTRMIAITSAADKSRSQFPTAGEESTGRPAAGSGVVPLDEKKRGSSADVIEEALGQGLESLTNGYGPAAARDG